MTAGDRLFENNDTAGTWEQKSLSLHTRCSDFFLKDMIKVPFCVAEYSRGYSVPDICCVHMVLSG